MKIYLISNNSLVEGLKYNFDTDLEQLRLNRSLSIKGEKNAELISNLPFLSSVEKIYSSFYSSAIATSKYLANKLDLEINLNDKFNDCKVGRLGSRNMKMLKGLQDHDFTYCCEGGESLNVVGNRLKNEIAKVMEEDKDEIAIFTHKRAIVGFLLKYANVGYNLDENLILEYNGKQIYDDIDTLYDIYELDIERDKIVDIILK